MRCPFCGSIDSRVLDSRPTEGNAAIRRRRECVACQRRFTTYEQVEVTPVVVIKKDGRREMFDAQKIMRGVMRACEKRHIPYQDVENLVHDVESQVYNLLEKEVSTKWIGELVMARLKNMDEVAYVRFACVHRSFGDINSFMDELKGLLQDK